MRLRLQVNLLCIKFRLSKRSRYLTKAEVVSHAFLDLGVSPHRTVQNPSLTPGIVRTRSLSTQNGRGKRSEKPHLPPHVRGQQPPDWPRALLDFVGIKGEKCRIVRESCDLCREFTRSVRIVNDDDRLGRALRYIHSLPIALTDTSSHIEPRASPVGFRSQSRSCFSPIPTTPNFLEKFRWPWLLITWVLPWLCCYHLSEEYMCIVLHIGRYSPNPVDSRPKCQKNRK